jgi:hypothetical protein
MEIQVSDKTIKVNKVGQYPVYGEVVMADVYQDVHQNYYMHNGSKWCETNWVESQIVRFLD